MTTARTARWIATTLVVAGTACGGAPPARERVARPCAHLAWIDEGRGSLAVQYRALGDDAWLGIDLREQETLLYGQDRLASVGVRPGDRHVLVPPLFGAQPIEMNVTAEPERPFAARDQAGGFIVGRLGREVLEGRSVELDTTRMLLCDRYPDEVESIVVGADATALAGPYNGRHVLIRVADGEARAGDM